MELSEPRLCASSAISCDTPTFLVVNVLLSATKEKAYNIHRVGYDMNVTENFTYSLFHQHFFQDTTAQLGTTYTSYTSRHNVRRYC